MNQTELIYVFKTERRILKMCFGLRVKYDIFQGLFRKCYPEGVCSNLVPWIERLKINPQREEEMLAGYRALAGGAMAGFRPEHRRSRVRRR